MYNQIKVTINPNAALHSNCLGAPLWTPFSIKSKSATKKRDAIPITKSENPIPTGPFPWIKGTWKPKKKPINDIRYITRIAPNDEYTAIARFLSQEINPALYMLNIEPKMMNVIAAAIIPNPGICT